MEISIMTAINSKLPLGIQMNYQSQNLVFQSSEMVKSPFLPHVQWSFGNVWNPALRRSLSYCSRECPSTPRSFPPRRGIRAQVPNFEGFPGLAQRKSEFFLGKWCFVMNFIRLVFGFRHVLIDGFKFGLSTLHLLQHRFRIMYWLRVSMLHSLPKRGTQHNVAKALNLWNTSK